MADPGHVRSLFDRALTLPPDERAAFLRDHCKDDASLRGELERLVDAHERLTTAAETATRDTVTAAVKPARDDTPGRGDIPASVGPYRIIREIGHGGMGAVYLAVRNDDEYKRRVAIKLLRRGLESDESIRRFRQERQMLASVPF